MYGLTPPQDVPPQARAGWVQDAAKKLLEGSLFLRYGVDELKKTRNFAHPALREAIIRFLYTGSYRIAVKRPDIFQRQIPLTCLALVCTAVFFGYCMPLTEY
jgi:hypothetical protein